jgi:hypothetical protein
MVHFKGLLSEKRSFGDFRTVLHTGLFSQLVAMEVPVGGDIGDEVRLLSPKFISRYTKSRFLQSAGSILKSSR